LAKGRIFIVVKSTVNPQKNSDMNRDGYMKSLWQDGCPDYISKNSWDKAMVYDVLIVGGGVTGLTTALLLQEQGKKCIVAEAHNLGFGTTSGTTAHLNTILDTPYNIIQKDFGKEGARLMADASREAIDKIEELIEHYDIQCGFGYKSGYLFAQDEKEEKELDDIKRAAEDAGCVTSWSTQIPVPMPFTKVVRFEFQAQLHNTRYLLALAAAFEAAGGVILQQCAVQLAVEDGEVVTATTTMGELQACHLVYATHIPPGLDILHLRCAPYRSYAAAFRLADDAYPDALAYDM
jgi:glycine/D-amino acid oxidase-like deaminating enzyme